MMESSEMRLIAAVINQAITDACLKPIKTKTGYKPRLDTVCALEDILMGNLDSYLACSNIDPTRYKTFLIRHMFSNIAPKTKLDYNLERRKNFRYNFGFTVSKLKKSNVQISTSVFDVYKIYKKEIKSFR